MGSPGPVANCVRRLPWTLLSLVLLIPATLAHPNGGSLVGLDATPPTLTSTLAVAEGANRVTMVGRDTSWGVDSTASDYALSLTCPRPPVGLGQCPIVAVDPGDILGNPALAIDPLSMERVIFGSLHGQGVGRPSNLSRSGQTHTTFTSLLYGTDWLDQPYEPPIGQATGEDVATAFGEDGTLHVASLYARTPWWEETPPPPETHLLVWKFDSSVRYLQYGDGYEHFTNRTDARIDRMWLLPLPEIDRVLLLWREVVHPNRTATIQGHATQAWITGAVTKMDSFSAWKKLPEQFLVSPCDGTTNPVAFRGRVYYGCLAGEDGVAQAKVRRGDVVLYRLDLKANETRPMGVAPLRGGDPHLAIDETGRMALVDVHVTADNESRLDVTTSQSLGRTWSRSFTGNPQINASLPVARNAINAVLYRGGTNTIHLIYREEAEVEDRLEGLPQWRKSLLAVDPVGGILENLDLDIRPWGDYGGFPGSEPADHRVYGDTHDSLIEVNGREFLAVADYGDVVYAEIIEEDHRTLEAVPLQAPPLPEPMAVPQANALQATQGVFAAAVAVEALRRLAVHKLAIGTRRDK